MPDATGFLHDARTPQGRAERRTDAVLRAQWSDAVPAATVNASLAALAVSLVAGALPGAALAAWWTLVTATGLLPIRLAPRLRPAARARLAWAEAVVSGLLWGALCAANAGATLLAAAVLLQALVFRARAGGPGTAHVLAVAVPAALGAWMHAPLAGLLIVVLAALAAAAMRRLGAGAAQSVDLARECAELEALVSELGARIEAEQRGGTG